MISQIKRRFEDLSSYLNKDTEGLKRLKALKDDVNVLRKALAVAEDSTRRAEETKNAARARADSAEAANYAAQLESMQLLVRVDALTREVASLTPAEVIEEGDHAESAGGDMQEHVVRAVLKKLRKEVRCCPKAIMREKETGRTRSAASTTRADTYVREEFATGWSHKDLWTLGAAVAVIASMNGGVTIVTDKLFKQMAVKGDEGPVERHMWQWFAPKNVEQFSAASSKLYEAADSGQHPSHDYI